MNHQKIYDLIIGNSILKNRVKLKKNDKNYIYYEEHHILPRCLGGDDNYSNLVLLTAKEHFICHKLLTYIYKGNREIACAFHRMVFGNSNKCNKSSRDYAYARELAHTLISEKTKQKIGKSRKGKKLSIETREKIRKKLLGHRHTKETIDLIKIHTKKGMTEEVIKKIKENKDNKNEKNPFYGHSHSKETKEKWSRTRKGKKMDDETRKKISLKLRNRYALHL